MLFKNVLRTLKKQYVQLLLLGVIIALSSFIYTTMDYGVGGILVPTEEYFDIANQEDFAISMLDMILEDDVIFLTNNCTLTTEVYTLSSLKNTNSVCYYNLMENRLGIIENEYDNINIELRESKDVYFDYNDTSYKIRFLKATSEINLSFFIKGNAPNNNSEIAISDSFGMSNNLDVGDNLRINGKDYTISGYVLFPDYSLALFSTNLIIDNKSQSIGLLTDEEFENLNENVGFEIAGDLVSGMTKQEFEEEVIDDFRNNDNLPFVTNIVLTVNNMRSGAIYAEIQGGQAMGLGLSLIIASIAILIVGIMVSKILQSQRGAIGILKSMGYSNKQITTPYIFFIAILSFPAIIIGYFLGSYAATPMSNMYKLIYLLPSSMIEHEFSTFIVAVIVPSVFLIVVSYFIIKKILSQKPVELLNPEIISNTSFLTKNIGKYLKKLKITSKLMHLLLYRNMVKFLVFIMGMFFAAFLILLSFSMVDIFDKLTIDYYEQTDHNYIGYCDYVTPCLEPSGSQEAVIELPSVIIGNEEVYLVGLNQDSNIHKLYDNKGNDVTKELDKGLIITESLSILKGFRIGDLVLLEVGDEHVTLEVVEITEEFNGNKAYINREDLGMLLKDSKDYYNVVYSETILDEDDFLVIISTQKIMEQSEIMSGLFGTVFSIMIIASVIIGAIIVYILTVMTIEDNFYNISLFKVIGYNNKEIDKMILGGYLLYGITIFTVTVPIALLAFKGMTLFFALSYDLVFPFEFKIWHAIISIGMFVMIFYIGAFVAKRKLNKISLQEAMKMYQI